MSHEQEVAGALAELDKGVLRVRSYGSTYCALTLLQNKGLEKPGHPKHKELKAQLQKVKDIIEKDQHKLPASVQERIDAHTK